MPQPKWYGKSLSVFCMESIIDNMDKWTKSRHLEYVSHQFSILPLHSVNYIQKHLFCRTEETLNLLMSQHLRILNLSSEYMSVHDKCESDLERHFRILRLASIKCSQLSQLKLSGNKNVEIFDTPEIITSGSDQVIKINDFSSLLGLFEHLQVLELSHTNYGANCLPILGSTHRPQLRVLFVDHCPGVTNTIIQDLCIGQTSLLELYVHKTEVTHIGAKFAIEHLPKLKWLFYSYFDFFKIFSEIHDEAREPKKYQLSILMSNCNIPYKKGSISLMVSMCPYIIDILIFVNEELTDFEFSGLRELRQIRCLVIFYGSPSLTFHGGILPVLKIHGHTLTFLHIEAPIFSREVGIIIDLCPNMRVLNLSINNDVQLVGDHFHLNPRNERSGESVPLKKLQVIHLFAAHGNSKFVISPRLLLLLLSSPALDSIYITKCLTLNDEIIEKVCARNSFENLTRLQLWDCPAVSQKGVDFFMNEKNPLEFISLRNCGDVDFESLKKKAKERHWDNVTITDEFDTQLNHFRVMYSMLFLF